MSANSNMHKVVSKYFCAFRSLSEQFTPRKQNKKKGGVIIWA